MGVRESKQRMRNWKEETERCEEKRPGEEKMLRKQLLDRVGRKRKKDGELVNKRFH